MKVTAERVRALLDYDPDSGVLRWRRKRGCAAAGRAAGYKSARGYVMVAVDNYRVQAGRFAWMHVNGDIGEGLEIDHINGNPGDNRICNLRAVTPTENKRNRVNPGGKNPVVGVYWNSARGNWRAEIRVDGKKIGLGSFASVESAHRAYLSAKSVYHGVSRQIVNGALTAPVFLSA